MFVLHRLHDRRMAHHAPEHDPDAEQVGVSTSGEKEATKKALSRARGVGPAVSIAESSRFSRSVANRS
ncbi:MAG: hypothetical protein WDN69_31030 [Aliidongia sp.]